MSNPPRRVLQVLLIALTVPAMACAAALYAYRNAMLPDLVGPWWWLQSVMCMSVVGGWIAVLLLVVSLRTAPQPVTGASPRLRRIQCVSHVLRVAVLSAAILYILAWIAWIHRNAMMHAQAQMNGSESSMIAHTGIPVSAVGWLLFDLLLSWMLFRLLSLYAGGIIFERRNAHWIRSIGYTFMVVGSGIYSVLIATLLLPLTTVKHVQYHANIDLLIGGGILLLLSWVMDEGSQLRHEQELTV